MKEWVTMPLSPPPPPPHVSVYLRYTTTPGTTSPALYEQCVSSLTSYIIYYVCKGSETGPTVYRPYPRAEVWNSGLPLGRRRLSNWGNRVNTVLCRTTSSFNVLDRHVNNKIKLCMVDFLIKKGTNNIYLQKIEEIQSSQQRCGVIQMRP